jgi:hypothetical protein
MRYQVAEKSKSDLRKQLQDAVINTGGIIVTTKKPDRTSRGLRDMLFDELDELRTGDGNPQKALAVASVAKQIVSTVRVEMEYYRLSQSEGGQKSQELGELRLGSANDALGRATER